MPKRPRPPCAAGATCWSKSRSTFPPRIDALLEEVARAGVTLGVFFQDRLKPDVLG